jgi:sulfur carrier protein
MLKINGEDLNFDGLTVTQALEKLGYSQQRVAVERNEEIVPKALYSDTILCAGDCVEVVRFVGGG